MQLLVCAPSPGNVRQLLNVIEQAVALAATDVIPESLVRQALDAGDTALTPLASRVETAPSSTGCSSATRSSPGCSRARRRRRSAPPHRMLEMTGLFSRCWLIALAALLAFPVAAQERGPDELVKKLTDDVLSAIKSDKQLASGDRQKALKLAEEKVLPHIDFQEAARLAVGRAWSQASAEQKEKLTAEFRKMLVRTYSNAIEGYEGQTQKIFPTRAKPDEKDATVRAHFIRAGGKPVPLEYQMRKTDQGWKIYDISIEGVSLVVTYRSEFDAVVKQNGIDGLIKRLTEKNTPAAVASSGKPEGTK
jgi:phospholipid transport system substrate-binding protein